MSHFTVMVIGPNPEEQLAPYDEDIEVEEYRRDDGETSTYNPLSKWDWYLLGGRWTGFLKLKQGAEGKTGKPGIMTEHAETGYADAARLCDIDIEGMRDEAEAEIRKKITKLAGIPRDWLSWEQVREQIPDVDAARTAYNAQPNMATAKKALDLFFDVDHYLKPDDELIRLAREGAFSTFAVLKNGRWYEKGKMGWWACVSDKKETDDWRGEVSQLLSDLPPTTLISIYDCHI